MEDEDFELAFSLYDRIKPKIVAPSVGFSSRFYQTTSTSETANISSKPSNTLQNHVNRPHSHAPTTVQGGLFRSSFTTAPVAKPVTAASLSVNQSTTSSSSSNRHFIIPTKSSYARSPKNHMIQVSTPANDTSIPFKTKSTSSTTSFSRDEVAWDSDDDILAPVPGVSRELMPASPKKASPRSPSSNRRKPSSSTSRAMNFASREENNHTVSMGAETEVSILPADAAALAFPPECDETEARTWHYPSNYEKREYQFAMVESALFKNTLVCLPTGLGKTLIAAVVMYNFYRWFPNGKIIFMAPTKPLVAQQIDACRDIVSIPPSDSIVMTGKMSSDTRAKHWASKRIFFVTPQIPQNDIASGICPADKICLLVFDEAHKAHGDFAYCDVIRGVAKSTPFFRVLALSATPGGDIQSIQEVLTNLLIAKIELRTEDSPDVTPYRHNRFIEEIPVKLEGPIMRAKELLKILITVPITWLQSHSALYRTKKGDSFTFTRLEAARNDFRNNPNFQRKDEFFKSNVEARFAAAMAMYYGSRLITDYGLGPFKEWLNAQTVKPMMEKTSNYFTEMVRSKEWNALYRFVNEEIGDPEACRHPKMTKLENVVLDHFHETMDSSKTSTNGQGRIDGGVSGETRVMVFVQFRDTVEEIVSLLKRHEPFIRPMAFVGQAKKGLSQKQQADVVAKFREGHYNTLVSTSIGEEGLDIGEVDLIVCYDAQQSPIRMIQRMGRTGRKRNGKCVMLLTTGTEDVSYKRSKVKSKQMIQAISSSTRFHFFNGAESAHLLPNTIPRPTSLMWHMEPIIEVETEKKTSKRAKKASTPLGGGKRTSAKATMAATSNHSNEEEEESSDYMEELNAASAMEGELMKNKTNWDDFEVEMDSPDIFDVEMEDKDEFDELIEPEVLMEEAVDKHEEDALKMNVDQPAPVSLVQPINLPALSQVQAPNNFNRHTTNHLQSTTTSPNVEKVVPPFSAPKTMPISPLVTSHDILATKNTTLDQSDASLDSIGIQLMPFDDFPPGFFSSTSNAGISIPPPPPDIPLPVDFDLGLIPLPPTNIESVSGTSIPKTVRPPLLMFPAPGDPPIERPRDKMIFHIASSPIASSSSSSNHSQVQSGKGTNIVSASPSPSKLQAPSATNTSILSSSILSLESNEPNSPEFKRLKRMRVEEEEDDLDFKPRPDLSPPPAKRSCTVPKKRANAKRNRFIDEEASLDEDNSDGGDVSGDDYLRDSIPNSQDIAFIAAEGECDTSLTGMQAVYAKSLSSPVGRGGAKRGAVQNGRKRGLDWLEGENLSRKLEEWAAYSDVEAYSSDGNNASVCSIESIEDSEIFNIKLTKPIKPIESSQAKDAIDDVILIDSSPESSHMSRDPPRRSQFLPAASQTASSYSHQPVRLGLGTSSRSPFSKTATSAPLYQTRHSNLISASALNVSSIPAPVAVPKTSSFNELFSGLTDDDLMDIDIDNIVRR
jgi:ERCC4-related helicase